MDDGPHQVLERIRRRKVESNLGGLLSNPRADFQQAKLDRVEVGPGPLRASHADVFERVQKHVGGAVQKEPELVGHEAMAGGAVRVQEGLVILDEAFHASAPTVALLIQKFR